MQRLSVRHFLLRFIKKFLPSKRRSYLCEMENSQLIERLSHEWRTSLTGVVGYAEFLEVGSAEPMMNFTAKVIRESGLVLTRITAAYVDLHRLKQGQLNLNCLRFNLSSAVEQSVEKMRTIAYERDVRLVFHCAPDAEMVSIYSDLTRIRQVIDAIVFNLVQMVSKRSFVFVTITSSERGGGVCFEYSSPSVRGVDLYKQFWDCDDYCFQMQAGPGVELAYVKELIKLLGCSVKYEMDKQDSSRLSIDFSRLNKM